MSNLKYWLGFNLVKGIGPAKLRALIDYFGSPALAWQATESQLVKLGIDKRAIGNLVAARQELDLDAQLARLQHAGIDLLTWETAGYPAYLQEIPDPPPLLYLRGELKEIDQWAVAVVGTRRLTRYGRQITEQLVTGLVKNRVTVVSGLARGIDAVAHKTAVSLGGRTIAVLGSGFNHVYPAENRRLADQIADGHGAVLTEYGVDVEPEAKNFPPRNRIISGISMGTIVVEAGERSGALITADFAVEQNREVFAVPGNVNSPASRGPNRLIQQGAKLVVGVQDVLEELKINMVAAKTAVQMVLPETSEEAAIYAHLSAQPAHVDDICRATGLPTAVVGSTLVVMELKGMVQQIGRMNYVLSREPDPIYQVNDEHTS